MRSSSDRPRWEHVAKREVVDRAHQRVGERGDALGGEPAGAVVAEHRLDQLHRVAARGLQDREHLRPRGLAAPFPRERIERRGEIGVEKAVEMEGGGHARRASTRPRHGAERNQAASGSAEASAEGSGSLAASPSSSGAT